MLASTAPTPPLAADAPIERNQFLPLLLVAGLLAFPTIIQVLFVLPNHRLYIRTVELLFAGLFLLAAGRSYAAPRIRPAFAGWVFVGWLVLTTLSVLLAEHMSAAVVRQAEWMTHLLYALALWSYLRTRPFPLKAILLAIPLGFVLTGCFLLFFWHTLSNPRDFNWFASVPLVGHMRHLGYYALAGAVFSAAPLLGLNGTPTRSERVLAFAAMAFSWGFLCWTGGRAAVGSAVLGLAVVVWFSGKGRRVQTGGLVLGAALLGLGLSAIYTVNDPQMGFFNAVERTAEASTAYGVNGFTTGRLTIWRVALDGMGSRYWFGLGPDGYRFIEESHHGIQPHGMPVQILVEWGLLGALPFVLLLGSVFWIGFARLRRETDPLRRVARTTAFAGLLAFTVHSLVDGLYYHPQPLLFIFTCFAVVLLPLQDAPPAPKAPRGTAWLTARPTLWTLFALLVLVFILTSNTLYGWIG